MLLTCALTDARSMKRTNHVHIIPEMLIRDNGAVKRV